MAQIILDVPLIKYEEVKRSITYFNELRKVHSDVSICRSLLEAVEREDISPSIFSAFLPWCRSPETIVLCLNNSFSRRIRLVGIKCFGKTLSNPDKWVGMWKSVGGTQGLVILLAKVSVTEVKALAKAIGRCRGQHVIPDREKAIKDLLCALLPSQYPKSIIKSQDKRPIQKYYAQIVAACSSEFVAQLLDSQDESSPLYQHLQATRLLKTHGELLQKRVVDAIFSQGKRDSNLSEYLKAFCSMQPSEAGPYPGVSASMAFSMKMLRMRLDNNDSVDWPLQVSEAKIFTDLFHRCIKKKLPKAKLRNIVSLGLKLLGAHSSLKAQFQSSSIWDELITRWGKSPEDYKDLLTQALQLDLGGPNNQICRSVVQLSKKLNLTAHRTWELLRLYCLHVPKASEAIVDLETSTDMKPLGKQQWSSELFYKLDKGQAIRLLKNLQISFPQENFLQGPSTSVLSGVSATKHRGAALLLIMLQRESSEVQDKVRNTVDELRKKSSTSREQASRAEFAIAALQNAIASGSLNLYGETITWLQRYARDPLTLKEVFRGNAVMTIEGITLLSGIPDPLPESLTLGEIASNIEGANSILMNFYETILIAKREPSFQQRDLNTVSSLFSAAIRRRVDHALAVQKHLLVSDEEIYAAISGNTLDILGAVNFIPLQDAYSSIQVLVNRLPPTMLAATASSLLATGAKSRKKDRKPGDDQLETLSYSALIHISQSDKPELAQQLILKTILDRPDASSWHRLFLSPAFMKSLPAEQAQEMLVGFATAIGEKLEEQSYVKVGEAKAATSAPPRSLVKVTTIKYLAQLLDNAEFISVDTSIDVLVELFKASTHRDIRLATLDSLLSLLNTLCNGADEKGRSSPLIEKIMVALETAIPTIGSINERRPPREEDWKEALETGKLVEVSDIEHHGLPPLMSALIYAPSGMTYSGLKSMRAEFVSRLFLPIYRLSQEEQRKWSTMFLTKHKVDLKASDLPPSPVRFQMCDHLVRNFADLLPQTVMNDYNKYIIMTIIRPAKLRSLNRQLKKDIEICDSPAVQYWLSMFDKSMSSYSGSGTQVLLSMVYDKEIQSAVSKGITNDKVQDMIISHVSLLLNNYNENTVVWNDFTKSLHHPCKATNPYLKDDKIRSMKISWQQNGRQLVKRVIEEVEGRKALFIQQGNLTVLPSTNILHHYLLPYPAFPPATELDGQCKLLADELEKQLDKCLGGDANILRWPRIAENAKTISELLNTNEERLRVASYVGKLIQGHDQKSSALNFVKLRLATGLIEDAEELLRKPKKEEVPEINLVDVLFATLKGNLQEWLVHPDESIREEAAEWKKKNEAILERF